MSSWLFKTRLFKTKVRVIILFLFVGSSGCMMTPPYAPPMESVESHQVKNSHQLQTNPIHRQSVSSFRQQQIKQQQQQLKLKQEQAKQYQIKQQQIRQQHFPNFQTQQLSATQQQQRQLQQPQQPQQWALQNAPQRNWSSTTWDDLLNLFGLSAFPTAQSLWNVPVVRQSSKPENLSATTKSNPITQVAYQLPQPSKFQNVPNKVRPTASPELYQSWNLENYRVKRSVLNPYRLVADTQETVANRTAPPVMNNDRLMTLSQHSQTSQMSNLTANLTATNRSTTPEKVSIFNLGRDLVKEFVPSNDRKWSQNHAVLQTAELNGNLVTVRNIRYSKYETAERYTTQYYDATFDLNDIRTIDLVVVPFRGIPRLAHVESSFGFADGRHLGMSIEARYEEGEQYDPIGAGLRQFELIYVFADERDMIRIGTDVNKNDVHIYRLKFEPKEVRAMFVDAVQRANKLAKKPEFYHPLTNSCVTNLIKHVNKGRPNAIPKEYRTLLPGLMDHYVYDLKLIDTTAKTFQETKENAKVNWLVEKFGDLEYFSAGIRQNMY
ncbi:MAG: DUF4105 domain-containing protein [Planctomycetaceae bacterium]|jgi:hypothetical protein|nr:DUF4105 domain-containing protein [Planctomycetaceae bacterium]